MKKSSILFSAACLFALHVSAQVDSAAVQVAGVVEKPAAVAAAPLKLNFPTEPGWNLLKEGQKLEFKLNATGGTDNAYRYAVKEGLVDGIVLDSLGNFSWTPSFDFVDRLSKGKTIQLLFEVKNQNSESITQVVDFKVEHVNRAPVVGELRPFYVQNNSQNTYTIEPSAIKDEDDDPIVFVPNISTMPQGAKLSAQGEFTWKPSQTMFHQLREKPLVVEFWVEDQPSKVRTKGQFRIEQTQEDLKPSIIMFPSHQQRFKIKENEAVNLRFELSDPNGESDITSFEFISNNSNVPKAALVKNTPSQYEFIWTPGYDFVKDPHDSIAFNITFYVLDRSNKREERMLRFTVLNAVNEVERDQKLYTEYRSALVRAWDLMEQLKDTEKDLKKKYNRAKKGKKGRSLTNASLGAVTGISPVVIEEPTTSKRITTVGGTVVMTIGTLEATEVIGRSTKDLVERLNYIMEKRNELQTKGDIFARKYALKSSRREATFIKDVDELVAIMNLKGLVALELDAGWQNKSKPTDNNIAKTFKDFNPDK